MSQLDYLLGRRGSAPSYAPRVSTGVTGRFRIPPVATGGGGSRPSLTAPERFDVNEAFDSLSNTGAGIFGTLGQLPSRVFENPVSIADTAARAFTGGRIQDGEVSGGFSPVEAIGSIPGVSQVAGFAGEAVERAGNFVPALINNTDARVWSIVGDLPDDTPINSDAILKRAAQAGMNPGDFIGETVGGVPITGWFGRAKTVGELRAELQKRGFFFDEEGRPLDPTQVALDIRRGTRSSNDFGFAAVNDNALVDVAARLTLDPSNVLFFVPGANLAKLGSLGSKLLPASRLVRAGAIAEKAPRGIVAADAILKGNRAQATLQGLGRVLRGYRTAAVASSIGTFGVNTAANAIVNLGGDDLPFVNEIADFTAAVQNNRPMSDNAAFMLLGAATFPYGHYAGQAIKGVKAVRDRTVGPPGDLRGFEQLFGGKQATLEQFGGPSGVRNVVDFIDVQIARRQGKISPGEAASFQSMGEMSLRRKFEQQRLWQVVNDARKNGEITGDMRAAEWKRWYAEGGGMVGRIEGRPFDRGARLPWDADAPRRSAARWRAWEPVRSKIQPALDDTGELIWGLRDDVVFAEQIDGAARPNLKDAVYVAADGKKRVPVSVIRDVLSENPNLNSLDKTGKWAKWASGEVDPAWDSVSRLLAFQRRDAVKIADYTADLARWEREAPPDIDPTERKTRQQRIDDLRAELDMTFNEDGTIKPDMVEQSHQIQRALEDELAAQKGVHWARSAEFDQDKTGGDPTVGRAVGEALDETELLAPAILSPGINRLDEATQRRVAALEAEVIKINPSYRVKRAPENDILALVPPEGAIGTALRQRRAVGEWLFETGPFSPISNLWHTITRQVSRQELAGDAIQALKATTTGVGLKPSETDAILAALQKAVDQSTITVKGLQVRMHRDIGSLPPGRVEAVVADVLNSGRKTPHPALGRIKQSGGFYRMLAKASSRYARSLSAKAAKGDKGARALRTIYDVWNDAPVLSDLATTQRTVAKFFYPLFRFAMDPRWLFLNQTEATALAAAKDGYIRAYKSIGEASPFAQRRAGVERAAELQAPDVGLFFGRDLELHLAKSFDIRSGQSVAKVLDEFGQDHPALRQVRESMVREARLIERRAQQKFATGEIKQRQFDADMARAARLRDGGTRALSEHLNETLYGFETQGVAKTVTDAARQILHSQEIDVLRETGMLDRLTSVYENTWRDVQRMFHGNPERSTLERLMNSYWLYWPISYNIKATKWLADIMLNGSFGFDNNALLAGKYAAFQEQHKDRLLHNPALAAMYESQPSLWFTAQMMFPMSPEDIGVSMGRLTRYAGTQAQNFLNSWLGTEIGAFTAEKQAEDPASAIGWLGNLGPIYSIELAQRLITEADDQKAAPIAPLPQLPTPSTGPLSLPVR